MSYPPRRPEDDDKRFCPSEPADSPDRSRETANVPADDDSLGNMVNNLRNSIDLDRKHRRDIAHERQKR
ncbi:MAG: hypothetical protein RIC16_00155 [Rhodospirillales bacterium]